MSSTESEHLMKARRLLRQAHQLSAVDAPEAVVHLCYYAMFHGATAVLLRHRDQAVVTHTGLIGAFGRLAKGLGACPT
ncbi:HEPN domain-containing protein [Thiorhodococcus mannitoliphagus]|uniref:HEPN domain-containing protein n=1 Tax=Thiorhodococcus mannitoliphagus TaxID=329406 RepID=A0A6P1E2C1_9GAMM|nr:HEPN domain-containing protein [Thiorhodococcus mannitoliphagus]NEX21835.1 HEPN domain-containing protein [Thiorhodococcus mannitoliphagus]